MPTFPPSLAKRQRDSVFNKRKKGINRDSLLKYPLFVRQINGEKNSDETG